MSFSISVQPVLNWEAGKRNTGWDLFYFNGKSCVYELCITVYTGFGQSGAPVFEPGRSTQFINTVRIDVVGRMSWKHSRLIPERFYACINILTGDTTMM